ncbi:MAG: methionine biosynthesis protein MetW [Alphaproteobacteria bacterium]
MNLTQQQARAQIRLDLQLVADLIEPNCRVLDVGAGDGALLEYLVHFKGVDGRGMEISPKGVSNCVSHGLSVIQGDAETDLNDYPDGSFDYVILSQTLQTIRDTKGVLANMARIGRRTIVSFPNFGHWQLRWHLMWSGRTPNSKALPYQWYDTPNIRICTIVDFLELCDELKLKVISSMAIDAAGRTRQFASTSWINNWLAQQAIFLLCRQT